MDVANELLDAIEIIVDKKIRENTAQIYFGVCKSVNGDSCVMSINGKNNTIHFYGSAPIVGLTYRVFVPNGNMSMAFAITGNDDRKGLYYSNSNLLDNWYFSNPVNQRGKTEYNLNEYAIDRWFSQNSVATVNSGYITFSSEGIGFLFQYVDRPIKNGDAVTFSVLYRGGPFIIRIGDGSGTGSVGFPSVNDWTIASTTIQSVSDGNRTNGYLKPIIRVQGASVDLKASKLELGSKQTLAHQENENWVLNEIPDYGEQLSRCQRYFRRRYAKATYGTIGTGVCVSDTLVQVNVPRTPMREQPSVSVSGDIRLYAYAGTYWSPTEIKVDQISDFYLRLNCTISGGTPGQAIYVQARNDASVYIDEIADL